MANTMTTGAAPATGMGIKDGAVSNEFDHAVGHSRQGAMGMVSKLTMAHGGELGGAKAAEQVMNVGSYKEGMGGTSNSGLSNPPTAAANKWGGASKGGSPVPKDVKKGL